ncbi:ABC transporter permease [Variovorax sp. J22G73]|uniref:ABC transporter permease n=1 Tax=unclassified Variovorax TaxID=663243 RepID=UPI0025761549|nr:MULTISPECIES: ABC transporter permease [unclassified Variovorax]MDM0008135.1 ABC transporter permease [Variovorax sp. J22R203]MDM0100641.1 ABC transporter permease [Variovorax sp. J22G73]
MSGTPRVSARDAAELAAVQPLRPADSSRWRGFVLPVAAIALWWLLSSLDIANSALLVSPAKVFDTAVDQVVTGRLWRALSASLLREATGFTIGTLAGLLLGALLGLSPLFNRVVGPSFNTFKQISLFAWIPLISVWFGLGDVAKVVFLSLAALVPVVVNTCDGIRTVPPGLLEVARVYGFTRWQTVTQVVLPAALPAIFTGVYLALIYSWLATIGAEYLLVAGKGIGNTLIEGSEHFQMDLVIFGMVVIGTVGWLMNAAARALERRLARWTGRAN